MRSDRNQAKRQQTVGVALEIAQWLGTQPGSATHDG
jgi:hypothetical protein